MDPVKTKTKSIRRRTYMQNLPRIAAIPKFLLPREILAVKELKDASPELSWEQCVESIVYDSVDIAKVLETCKP